MNYEFLNLVSFFQFRLQDDDAHVEMEPLVISEDASELKERSNSISEGGNYGVNKRTSFKIK